MPNRKKRARRRQGGAGVLLPALIVFVSLMAAALIWILMNSDPFAPGEDEKQPYSTPLQFAKEQEASAAPLVLGAAATPEPTEENLSAGAAASASPAPEEQEEAENAREEEESKEGENRLLPTPIPGDYFLPVCDRALRTPEDRAMIAITIDGCDDADAMTRILHTAELYGARLTLFPTGEALNKLGSGFRTCVRSLGYELECCTYTSGKKDYTLSNSELAIQIFTQSAAASRAITRDYQQHFYRPCVKESACDQRTHYYLGKLGFVGIGSYTYSYEDHDLDFLVKSLENGNIYQFDMSEESLSLLDSFMAEANNRGYALVTMNELFGLEENEIGTRYTGNSREMPNLDDYVATYYELKLNDRSDAVKRLQARLMGLGYLVAGAGQRTVADGIYGASTSVAVSKFQAQVGIIATGNADVETQEKLFSQDAPMANG